MDDDKERSEHWGKGVLSTPYKAMGRALTHTALAFCTTGAGSVAIRRHTPHPFTTRCTKVPLISLAP
eukprot:14133996-Alexandrium_andersonii.AAC.1